jgi:hypothetical protein
MSSVASERLQEMLEYWQDLCWYWESRLRAEVGYVPDDPMVVPSHITKWKEFEQIVFDNTIPAISIEEWGVPPELYQEFRGFIGMHLFPLEFFEWSRKSRRVFNLPQGLCQVLGQATYPEVRWKDVLWPFDSFVITLEYPIQCEDMPGVWSRYDAILVTKIPETGHVELRMMRAPHTDKKKRRIPDKSKRRFELLLKRGDEKKTVDFLGKTWTTWSSNMKSSPGWRTCHLVGKHKLSSNDKVKIDPEDLMSKPSDEMMERVRYTWGSEEYLWMVEPISWAAKIAVGWCLYLQTLSSLQVSWAIKKTNIQKIGSRGVTGVITNVDNICTVLGEARLDPSSYGVNDQPSQDSGLFKRPHWRRAHYRRPRGSHPRALKTVAVPPLLIRKDLIPFFGIIGGTKTEVISED